MGKETSESTLAYIMRITGLSREEAEPIAKNWDRTEPQTDAEVREGVEWERENRLASADETWVKDLKKKE